MSGERLRGASVANGVLQRIHVDHDPVITREAHVFVLAEADRFEEALAASVPPATTRPQLAQASLSAPVISAKRWRLSPSRPARVAGSCPTRCAAPCR